MNQKAKKWQEEKQRNGMRRRCLSSEFLNSWSFISFLPFAFRRPLVLMLHDISGSLHLHPNNKPENVIGPAPVQCQYGTLSVPIVTESTTGAQKVKWIRLKEGHAESGHANTNANTIAAGLHACGPGGWGQSHEMQSDAYHFSPLHLPLWLRQQKYTPRFDEEEDG